MAPGLDGIAVTDAGGQRSCVHTFELGSPWSAVVNDRGRETTLLQPSSTAITCPTTSVIDLDLRRAQIFQSVRSLALLHATGRQSELA